MSSDLSVAEKIQRLRPPCSSAHNHWMIHIRQDTVPLWEKDFLSGITSRYKLSHCARDFFELFSEKPLTSRDLLTTALPRWICPIEHRWPASLKTPDFTEKAAQGLHKKFGHESLVFTVFAPHPELRNIATHIRARALQLCEKSSLLESQTVLASPSLNVMVSKSGIVAGRTQNRIETGSVFDAGLSFLNTKSNGTRLSRAAGKISEVLMFLDEVQITTAQLPEWLELGAAPGGMTKALVDAGARVTAVDLANMHPALLNHPRVTHVKSHAADIRSAKQYSVLLSDMNGPNELATATVARLIKTMSPDSLIVHTLKVQDFTELKASLQHLKEQFSESHSELLLVRHLFHNRRELTIIARKTQ